jgi:Serine/threonine protein kinase
MSSAPRVCRKCGTEIFADAPEGLCTACLFETGLDLLVHESVAGFGLSAEASANADDLDPDGVRLADRNKKSARPKIFADFGDYELLEVIGRGGQGVVYRARQKSLNRTVALKVIGLGHWAADAHLKRFRREAEAAARLDHFGIVPIYEVGERDGSCYFSMKLVEGGQLDAVVKREPMPIRQAVELIAKVARTVHYAHEHGILHRDIKPGNILLDQKGEPHLTDFGLARLIETESTVTRTMEVLGTPSYMAPEQAVGNNAAVSSVTDVYGLGAVLYQLLTAHPPFAGGTTYETIKLLLDTEPRQPRLWNSKIDRDLSTICLKCLEKDPRRRYSSALALAEDLERWLKHEPIRARRTGLVARGRKWVRRNPTSALLAASLVALAAAAGWIIWKTEFIRQPETTGIAVLPFENLSDEKEHAFFTDGVKDELLSNLSKIKDLKVISRTSVMQYKAGITRNLKDIAQQLGVSNVVEGSVRRSGNRVRVSVQLVDAQTDRLIWVQNYDRTLADSLTLEGDLATEIATAVGATLSPQEKARAAAKPTDNPEAYELYVKARGREGAVNQSTEDIAAAEHLYEQAIALDPKFALAHARLSMMNSLLAHQPSANLIRRGKARAAAEEALRLAPSLGEARMALGVCLYWVDKDYAAALKELSIAAATSPNEPDLFYFIGGIYQAQGRWREAIATAQRAQDRDPRNREVLLRAADNHLFVRDWAGATACYNRALEIAPDSADARISLAYIEVFRKGNPAAGRKILQNLPPDIDPDGIVTEANWDLAMLERDYTSAEKNLDRFPLCRFPSSRRRCEGIFPRPYRPSARGHRIGPALFCSGGAKFRRTDARRSRQRGPPCSTRITVRLHAQREGCPPGKSSSRRTRAAKPQRILFRQAIGQSGAGLCAPWRTRPGDLARRASPLHPRPARLAGFSVEYHTC